MLFKVQFSKATKKGNFFTKLQNKSEVVTETPFGNVTSSVTTTFYMFTDKQNAVGFEGDLTADHFKMVEKDMYITGKEDDNGVDTREYFYDIDQVPADTAYETGKLKYLYPKKA